MSAKATKSTVIQPAARVCPRCGVTLGGFGPEGLCPACLLRAGLELVDESAPDGQGMFQPRRFGDYELLEEIARGGMGVIYRARHLKLNRIVAVKMILAGQHAGVAELARFRAEAQTAAQLQHPNIVAIHEVGEHDGQPFFSMDFVAGQNLAQIVGNTPLPAKRAAKYLFLIAQAVQYAHQHGVLHRDLKPSNVLIDSATDEPRVTDFGLAKRLEGDVSLTMTGQVLGSPGFMPPEQAAGQHAEIGLVSDVYSLGAMLYHLLTGRPPFVADTVPATLRMVVESEPISPRLLNASVPRDLETICLKCLEKETPRRYSTAKELAEELGRFTHDEPIRARPASSIERAWRWCQRNRAVATAILLLLVVAVGSPITAYRINRARQQAETNATRSRQVAEFLQDMLKAVNPSIANGRDTALLQEILAKTAIRVGRDLSEQPEVKAELQTIIGEVYKELGEYKQAEMIFRESLMTRRAIFGDEHPAVAASLNDLGGVLWREDKLGEAETVHFEALDIRRKAGGNEAGVAQSLDSLAGVLWRQGKPLEAERMQREALALQRSLSGLTGRNAAVANLLDNLAAMLWTQGKLTEAERTARDALEMRRALFGPAHTDVAISLNNLANVLLDQGKLTEAEALHREALDFRRKTFGNEHTYVATSLANLAMVLNQQGNQAQAEPLVRECLAIYEKRLPDDWRTFNAMSLLGGALLAQTNLAEAEPLLLSGYEGMKQRELKIPSDSKRRLPEAIERLVQFYQLTSQPMVASEWKQRWAEYHPAKPGTTATHP